MNGTSDQSRAQTGKAMGKPAGERQEAKNRKGEKVEGQSKDREETGKGARREERERQEAGRGAGP